MNINLMLRNKWVFIFSPFITGLIIFAAWVISLASIGNNSSEGFAMLFMFLFLIFPYILAALLVDMLLRIFFKGMEKKVLYIWAVELTLAILALIILYIFWW